MQYTLSSRMPGHMNVLLAEANVPYEQLIEMDEFPEFPDQRGTGNLSKRHY